MKEIKQAKLNHVRSVNFTQSEKNSVNSGARSLNKTHYIKTVKSSAKRPRDYTSPAGCIEQFQKQRLQNFFDHVYFHVDIDEKETLLSL